MTDYTKEIEDVLKYYAEEAEIMYMVHNRNFLYYQKQGHYYTIPVIIMSTVSGVLSFNGDIQGSSIGQYTIGAINIVCGIITTIYKFLSYSNYENQHRLLAIEYLHLYEDIRSVLSKAPEQRVNAIEYVERVEAKRQELYDNFSTIQNRVRIEFKHRFRNMGVEKLPVKLEAFSTVDIYGRDERGARGVEGSKEAMV
jgi:hypothetical protein